MIVRYGQKPQKDEAKYNWAKFIGKRIKAARESRKMSQSDLATKAGFRPSAISHFELGRRAPSTQNLTKLSDALSVRTDWLLGLDDDKSLAGGSNAISLLRAFGKMIASDQEAFLKFAEMMATKKNSPASGGGDEGGGKA